MGKSNTEVKCSSSPYHIRGSMISHNFITGDFDLDRLVKVVSTFFSTVKLLFSLSIFFPGESLSPDHAQEEGIKFHLLEGVVSMYILIGILL